MTIIVVKRGTRQPVTGQTFSKLLSDDLSLSDALARQKFLNRLKSDTLTLSDAVVRNNGSSFPFSYNDSVFDSATTTTAITVANNGTISDKKVSTVASGDEQLHFNGSGTANRIALDCREGVRCVTGTTINLNWCYVRVVNVPGDHADGLQCFGGGGASLVITTKNSTFVVDEGAHTGYFSADDFDADHVIDTCLFRSDGTGQFGLRLNVDGGRTVRVRNSYFQQSVFDTPWQLDITVSEWSNNHWCTFPGGVFTPGALISSP